MRNTSCTQKYTTSKKNLSLLTFEFLTSQSFNNFDKADVINTEVHLITSDYQTILGSFENAYLPKYSLSPGIIFESIADSKHNSEYKKSLLYIK